jgi:hypothetical protein
VSVERAFCAAIRTGNMTDFEFIDIDAAAQSFYFSPSLFGPEELPPAPPPFSRFIAGWTCQGLRLGPKLLNHRSVTSFCQAFATERLRKNGWVVSLFTWVLSEDKRNLVPFAGRIEVLDSEGKLVLSGKKGGGEKQTRQEAFASALVNESPKSQMPPWLEKMFRDGELSEDQATDVCTAATAPVLYAMGVMACQNVALQDWHFPRQLRRRDPMFHLTMKRLIVTGGLRRKKEEDEDLDSGHGVARHICRGHFRDYRTGPGLFGKTHGMFWTPPHMRGSEIYGSVIKTYQVG